VTPFANEYRSRARDWFTDEPVFRELCDAAVAHAATEGEESFAKDFCSRASLFGLNALISERQLRELCEIAEVAMPVRLTDREAPPGC
jgi:hypothetical protein